MDKSLRREFKQSGKEMTDEEKAVQRWKIKKLVKTLDNARGSGTSMISLIVPPKDQISRVSKLLQEEYGTAGNIKSRVNRLSVLAAITSAQQKLKLFNKVPDNGLIIYCGSITTDDNKEKKVSFALEPFKPVNTSLYMCDSKFHTEALANMLESDEKFGFIVMDGNGSLFGTLAGNARNVLHKFTVDLPKKHGRGGQSALRFARLRLEKRHNYVRKVAELATQFFITNDKPNVSGLVLAGSAEFKQKLSGSDLFDQRLSRIVVKIVDVSYGGENGFNQAIELAADALANVKYVREKRLLGDYFEHISKDTGKYCFGVKDTLNAIENGACSNLIVWENLEIQRFELVNPETQEAIVKCLTPAQETQASQFIDKKTKVKLDVKDQMPLLEWLAQNYTSFGTKLDFVTNRSQLGSQFCKGFGGIGGILRYKLDFAAMEDFEGEFDDGDGSDSYSSSDADDDGFGL